MVVNGITLVFLNLYNLLVTHLNHTAITATHYNFLFSIPLLMNKTIQILEYFDDARSSFMVVCVYSSEEVGLPLLLLLLYNLSFDIY